MAVTDPTIEEPISEPMRRVLEALIAGDAPPPEAQAALTESERQELAALTRTAYLTALTLQQPDPPEEAEERSLDRARRALANRPPRPAPLPPVRSSLQQWLDRLRGRQGE